MKSKACAKTSCQRNLWIKARGLTFFIFAGFLLTNCNRKAPTAEERPAPGINGREAYCLVLQARLFTVRSLLAPSPSRLKVYRDEAARVLASLKADNAYSQSKLPELYGEVIRVIDAHEEYVSEIDRIARALKQREEADSSAARQKALIDFFTKGALEKSEQDESWLNNSLKQVFKSSVTGVQSYLQEEDRLKQLREQDKEGKYAACQTKYDHARTDFAANTKALTGVISGILSIPRKELGMETVLEDIEFYRKQDAKSVAEARKTWAKDRPKDPIVQAGVFLDSAEEQKQSLSACIKLAEECNALAATVPNTELLSYTRYDLLHDAASIVENYFYLAHPFGESWGQVRDDKALIPASYRKKATEVYSDKTGEDASNLAWDHFLAGEFETAFKFGEVAKAAPSFQNSSRFCFKMAQVASLTKRSEEALTWLATLVNHFQYNDIDALYSDSDLESLRSAKPEAFDALLKVTYDWEIKFGVFNDDILLTNQSRFPITDVHFKTHITSGTKDWDLDLRTQRIEAGEIYMWENALSVPGSSITSGKGTLSCAQMHAPLR